MPLKQQNFNAAYKTAVQNQKQWRVSFSLRPSTNCQNIRFKEHVQRSEKSFSVLRGPEGKLMMAECNVCGPNIKTRTLLPL